MPSVRSALMLGGGLCSMVQVMHSKGHYPQFTIVEKDKVVLEWAMELLTADGKTSIEPICSDAQIFMQRNTQKYDLIFVDIFMGRVVPRFVITPAFMQQCQQSLTPKGRLAFNYIVNDAKEWEQVRKDFATTFPNFHIIDLSPNQVLIS